MTKELNVSPKIRNRLDDFVNDLKDIYGTGLISAVVYGSVVSGEFSKKYSNINLLIVLEDASLKSLKKAGKIVKRHKFSLINPLFLSRDYILGSLDVFPVEFLDMKENYFVLSGEDILNGLEIDIKNLRFQCEQELKVKLLQLKNAYLFNSDKNFLKDLLFKSVTSLTHLLRNLLRLKGKIPSYLKQEVLSQAAREFGVDVAALSRVLEARIKNLRLSRDEIDEMFCAFVGDLEKIVKIVDKI